MGWRVSEGITHDIQIADNVFVRMMRFKKAGTEYDGHSHKFDHISLLAAGSVRMKHDKNGGGEQVFSAPYLIVVSKGVEHQFTSLEDNTVLCCIHAVRDGDGVDDVSNPNLSLESQWQLMSKYGTVEPKDE